MCAPTETLCTAWSRTRRLMCPAGPCTRRCAGEAGVCRTRPLCRFSASASGRRLRTPGRLVRVGVVELTAGLFEPVSLLGEDLGDGRLVRFEDGRAQ